MVGRFTHIYICAWDTFRYIYVCIYLCYVSKSHSMYDSCFDLSIRKTVNNLQVGKCTEIFPYILTYIHGCICFFPVLNNRKMLEMQNRLVTFVSACNFSDAVSSTPFERPSGRWPGLLPRKRFRSKVVTKNIFRLQ